MIMRLNHESYGEGPSLIIMHGLLGSLDNWRAIGRKLGAYFRVFCLDLRNHGRSPHSEKFDYRLMAEDLKEFMDCHAIDSASLLGHSMGGKVAMRFALLWPELVDRLIVADIAPRLYSPVHQEILQGLLALDLGRFADRMEIGGALLDFVPDDAMRRFLLKNLVRNGNGTFAWRMNLGSIVRNYGEVAGGIDGDGCCDVPALFLKGEKSDYIRGDDMETITALFPHARLSVVPSAGHLLHSDAPEEFLASVLDFLGSGAVG